MTKSAITLNNSAVSYMGFYFYFLARFMGFFNHALNINSSRNL